jgi:hypothetical protein
MSHNDQDRKSFLEELHKQTKGDLQSQVSMYAVGAAIGFAKGEAGSLAEGLMVEGLVELRTLSGAISITREGLASLGISAPTAPSTEACQRFSKGPIADQADRKLLCHTVDAMKSTIPTLKLDYNQLEEIIIDLKTIEVHLLSPSPKVAVFRELLRSLHSSFQSCNNMAVMELLAPLIKRDGIKTTE